MIGRLLLMWCFGIVRWLVWCCLLNCRVCCCIRVICCWCWLMVLICRRSVRFLLLVSILFRVVWMILSLVSLVLFLVRLLCGVFMLMLVIS